MLVPNPSTQPDQPTVPPTRKLSEATSEQINQKSKSLSRELNHLPRASLQHQTSRKATAFLPKLLKLRVNPNQDSDQCWVQKKSSQWGDSKPEPEQAFQSCDCPGSHVMNKVKAKPEEEWKVVSREQSPCKLKAPPPLPTSKTECSRSCPQ